PRCFTDELKEASLESPVDGRNAQGVVVSKRSSISIVARCGYFHSEHRTVGQPSHDSLAVVDIKAIICSAFPLSSSTSACCFIDIRSPVCLITARASRDVKLIVHLTDSAGINRSVESSSSFSHGGRNNKLADQRTIGQVVQW